MEQCVRCGEIENDRRTLRMSCLYEMSEMKIPFKEVQHPDRANEFTLRVCKKCRGEWMKAIEAWFLNIRKGSFTQFYEKSIGERLRVPVPGDDSIVAATGISLILESLIKYLDD